MVPILFSSKKLNANWIFTLALFDSELGSSDSSPATDITLEGWEPVFPGAVKMKLIVPSRGLEEAFPRALDLDWSPCPLGRYKNCCNLPSQTSCSRWFIEFCSPWWYIPAPSGISNGGSGCASSELLPFCLAIWSLTPSWSFPRLDALVLKTQC